MNVTRLARRFAWLCLLGFATSSLWAQPLPNRPALLAEINQKMIRVRHMLTQQQLAGVLLWRTNNVSWLTAGLGDNHILLTSEVGPAGLLLLRDGRRYVVGPKTETDHLLDENLRDLGYQPLAYNWYDAPPACAS